MNRIRTLNMWCYQFIDSLSFLDSSLDKVVNDLSAGDHDFPILKRSGVTKNQTQLDLIQRKGVFPYSALKDLKEFEEMKEIPPQETFFSCLNQEHISDADYLHAKTVFKEFGCRNMKDYLLLYNGVIFKKGFSLIIATIVF